VNFSEFSKPGGSPRFCQDVPPNKLSSSSERRKQPRRRSLRSLTEFLAEEGEVAFTKASVKWDHLDKKDSWAWDLVNYKKYMFQQTMMINKTADQLSW
jgi:hypothetical protein